MSKASSWKSSAKMYLANGSAGPGELMAKAFQDIDELTQDPNLLMYVVIDEMESTAGVPTKRQAPLVRMLMLCKSALRNCRAQWSDVLPGHERTNSRDGSLGTTQQRYDSLHEQSE